MSSSLGDLGQVQDSQNFAASWREYAMRRNLALFLLVGWLPFCGGLFLLSRYWLHQPELFLALMVVWLLAAFAAAWWAGEFRCPRCRRRFAALGRGRSTNITRGLFDKICWNYKLAKFERESVPKTVSSRPAA
jgi:hypothetical protein